MLFPNPIMSIASWLILALSAWWITKSIQGTANSDHGQSVVQYGPGIRALSVVAWLAVIGLTLLALLEPIFPIWCRVTIPIAAFFLAAVLQTELWHAQLRFDRTGVHVISPWRGDRTIAWSEFRRVTFSTFSNAYICETSSFGNISIHRWLSGIDSFIEELDSHGVSIDLDD